MSAAVQTVSGETGLGTLVRLALPGLPGVGVLPGIRKHGGEFAGLAFTRPPVTLERPAVEAYADVCHFSGLGSHDTVPLTYPHLLAFGLQMAMMSDPAFPVPAMGMVHLENSITQHRRLAIGETVEVSASVGPGRAHPRGTVFDLVSTVTADGATVWEETSTYLRRGRGDESAPWGLTLPEVAERGTGWKLPADLGRRYGAVSGDINPIHLTPLTAKALGFKRQIAHGMWTLARSVAALENRLPAAVRVDAAFRKPAFLPSTVMFGAHPTQDGWAFALAKQGSDTVHLNGLTTAL
ncbi:MaoC/PaaZ C-terminal domain-containing protein [Nocardioides sp.]|uniref:MaoC family dehydratase n=1 Tax=Nocardioides sp. TaxID=35761 RepID=UPI0026263379|nr:MaoC/PaaZ C-terminal domain-containing protein [Nocardioides sp.]